MAAHPHTAVATATASAAQVGQSSVALAPPVPYVEDHRDLGRADLIALGLGARLGVGALVVACLLAIMLGAQSMLGALESTERDLQKMSENLAVTSEGLDVLNKTMASLPPTSREMRTILGTVDSMTAEIRHARGAMEELDGITGKMAGGLDEIAASTGQMQASLERVDAATGRMGSQVERLDASLPQLVQSQSQMVDEVQDMSHGTTSMNNSLAYVIRILNYMARPPHGGDFTVVAEPDPATMPKVPGLKVETAPVGVFPRNAWPIYEGP